MRGGRGRPRNGVGRPLHLRRWDPAAAIVSLGLFEVVEGARGPADYAAFLGTAALPFDFVWFTPIADPENPCAKFAEQLKQARDRHENDTEELE